jgi:hypothetical protein
MVSRLHRVQPEHFVDMVRARSWQYVRHGQECFLVALFNTREHAARGSIELYYFFWYTWGRFGAPLIPQLFLACQ